MKMRIHALLLLVCALSLWTVAAGQANKEHPAQATPKTETRPEATQKVAAAAPPSIDLSKQPTLYVVGYAHLDTEWRWEYPQTIQEYLSKTLRNNFALAD